MQGVGQTSAWGGVPPPPSRSTPTALATHVSLQNNEFSPVFRMEIGFSRNLSTFCSLEGFAYWYTASLSIWSKVGFSLKPASSICHVGRNHRKMIFIRCLLDVAYLNSETINETLFEKQKRQISILGRRYQSNGCTDK